MPSCPVVPDGLIADLRSVENWLTSSLGVAADKADKKEIPDPFSPPDNLDNLKLAIDRIRPLLWVYLTRQHETRELSRGKKPASVRSLMEEALSISDRYVGREE